MYIPEHFSAGERALLWELITAHPFATQITVADGAPFVSQVPLIRRADEDLLIGHVARANPQWHHFACGGATALFSGPHAYISPAWYESAPAVPTWNYAHVQVSGPVRLLEDPADALEVLRALTAVFEPGDRWRFDDLPPEYLAKMARGIVAFEVRVARLDGKLKLSQNKPATDRDRVVAALAQSPDSTERAVADWMRRLV